LDNFIDCAGYGQGIGIFGYPPTASKGNIVSGNTILNWGTDSTWHAIYVGGVPSTIISNNYMRTNAVSAGVSMLIKSAFTQVIGNTFDSSPNWGIHMYQGELTTYPENSPNGSIILSNTFFGGGVGAIYLSYNGNVSINDVQICHNAFNSCSVGVYLVGGVNSFWRNIQVMDNVFTQCYEGVKLYNQYASNTKIEKNLFKNCFDPITFYATEPTTTTIQNNHFDSPTWMFLGTTPTTATMIRWNVGYKTESSGSTASCVNGTAIAHGMVKAPTFVLISLYGTNPYVNSTAWYFVPTILSANSTHFVISFCMNIGGTYTPVGAGDAKTIFWQCQTWNFP
jgi:hypothetical protein